MLQCSSGNQNNYLCHYCVHLSVLGLLAILIIFITILAIFVPILIILTHLCHHETCLPAQSARKKAERLRRIVLKAHPLQAAHRLVTVDGEDQFMLLMSLLRKLNLIESDVDTFFETIVERDCGMAIADTSVATDIGLSESDLCCYSIFFYLFIFLRLDRNESGPTT